MEFSAAKSVGNSEKIYICLSMKNRSNIPEPAAHSSIMSSKQLLLAHKRLFHSLCVYLCMSVYICTCPRVCTCVCIFMHVTVCVLWQCCDSYLDVFVIFFPSRHPISRPEAANGKVSNFFFSLQRSVTGRWPPCGLN